MCGWLVEGPGFGGFAFIRSGHPALRHRTIDVSGTYSGSLDVVPGRPSETRHMRHLFASYGTDGAAESMRFFIVIAEELDTVVPCFYKRGSFRTCLGNFFQKILICIIFVQCRYSNLNNPGKFSVTNSARK